MEKVNYPVKYALLPVKEEEVDRAGRIYYKIVCYIVSKAYVEEEYRKEKEDGSVSSTYKVCFPHTIYDGRINYLMRTPDSPLVRNNEGVVSELCDSYEEAVGLKEKRNLLFSEDAIKRYQGIEEEILELTKDLEVKKGKGNKCLEKK